MIDLVKKLQEWSKEVEHYADPTAEVDPNIKHGRLIFNENLLLPEDYYEEIIKHVEKRKDQAIRFYPSARIRTKIEEKLSEIYGIDRENILLTAGADEGMKLTYDMCSKVTDRTLIVRPCYGMAKIYAKSMKMKVLEHIIDRNYRIDPEKILEKIEKEKIGLTYICNPNNPLSIEFDINSIEEIVKNTESLIMIDETYHEFGTINHAELVRKYDNIIIIRSLSKSWGLAGLRVGYVVAPEYVINIFKGIMQPFNISSIALIALERAVELYDIVRKTIDEIKNIREEIIEEIKKIEDVEEVFNSKTNFITFRLKNYINVKKIVERLREKGFYVRTSSEPLLENCIRVTVGPREIMHKFITCLVESIYEYKRSIRQSRATGN